MTVSTRTQRQMVTAVGRAASNEVFQEIQKGIDSPTAQEIAQIVNDLNLGAAPEQIQALENSVANLENQVTNLQNLSINGEMFPNDPPTEISQPASYRLRAGENGVIEVSEGGKDYVALAKEHLFNVKDYGAKGNGVTDDVVAIRAALDAAAIGAGSTGRNHVVFFPSGDYCYSGPSFVGECVSVIGEGYNGVQLLPWNYPHDTVKCHPLIFCKDLSDPTYDINESYMYTPSALGGNALKNLWSDSLRRYMVDISVAGTGRIPATGAWNISFRKTLSSAPVDYGWIWGVHGTFSTTIPLSAFVVKIETVSNKLQFSFRYNGQIFIQVAQFAAQSSYTIQQNVPFEISMEWSGTTMRFFLNGELWTLGNWTPTGGLGSADGSGFVQYPWEHTTLGCGAYAYGFMQEPGVSFQDGKMDWFWFSDGVRHTANYTPSVSKPNRDSNTRLLFKFDRMYRGCLIAESYTTNRDHYFYPFNNNGPGHGFNQLKDISFTYGFGLIGEQNYSMIVENVKYFSAEDGLNFFRNGYYQRFRNVDVLVPGRVGIQLHGGSYVDMVGVKSEGPVNFVFNYANVYGLNVNPTPRGDGRLGMFCQGGTVKISGFNIDAEDATNVPWMAAVWAKNMQNLVLDAPTLYSPPNKQAANEKLVVAELSNPAPPNPTSCITINQPFIINTGGPFVTTVGSVVNWESPIEVNGPRWVNTVGTLCNVPMNVVDTREVAAKLRFASAAPTIGTWTAGTIVYNTAPVPGGNVGWVCTTAGTPGTWKAFGTIAA